jgi:hypothetical protein
LRKETKKKIAVIRMKILKVWRREKKEPSGGRDGKKEIEQKTETGRRY